jgi:hypothetical protein
VVVGDPNGPMISGNYCTKWDWGITQPAGKTGGKDMVQFTGKITLSLLLAVPWPTWLLGAGGGWGWGDGEWIWRTTRLTKRFDGSGPQLGVGGPGWQWGKVTGTCQNNCGEITETSKKNWKDNTRTITC